MGRLSDWREQAGQRKLACGKQSAVNRHGDSYLTSRQRDTTTSTRPGSILSGTALSGRVCRRSYGGGQLGGSRRVPALTDDASQSEASEWELGEAEERDKREQGKRWRRRRRNAGSWGKGAISFVCHLSLLSAFPMLVAWRTLYLSMTGKGGGQGKPKLAISRQWMGNGACTRHSLGCMRVINEPKTESQGDIVSLCMLATSPHYFDFLRTLWWSLHHGGSYCISLDREFEGSN